MKRGFTTVELIIVIAMLAIIAVFSIPFLQSFQVSSDLTTTTNTLSSALRRARQQAIDGQQNSSWGVFFDESHSQYVVFKGTTFASRDQSFDQIENYSPFAIQTTFNNEIDFAVYSGTLSVSGTTTVSDANNAHQNVSINSLGLIQIHE